MDHPKGTEDLGGWGRASNCTHVCQSNPQTNEMCAVLSVAMETLPDMEKVLMSAPGYVNGSTETILLYSQAVYFCEYLGKILTRDLNKDSILTWQVHFKIH